MEVLRFDRASRQQDNRTIMDIIQRNQPRKLEMALKYRVVENHSYNAAVVIWAYGNPGTGKTSVCQSVCAFLEY